MTQAPPPASPPPAPAPAAPAPARRPGLDPATGRQTIIVAAVIAALFYGSQVVNEALPANAQGQVAATSGVPVAISAVAQITPLSGWVATEHESGNGIRLEKGIVVIDLFTRTFGANAGELAGAYLDDVLRPDATQITTSETEVVTTETGTAARFAYQGIFKSVEVPIEGEVTALFASGHGVIADAWTRQGELGELLEEIHAMLGTIEVRA
jgi:ketosteroid isomerase-like protein